MPELKAFVGALEQQKAEMAARLAKLKSGNVKPVSLEERKKVNGEHRKWEKTANARKKIRIDVWQQVAGEMEKKEAAELKENLCLEF